MKRTLSTDEAPAAVGAYSQATTNGDLVFTAGQIPLTPDGDLLDDANVATQTERALDNLLAVLGAAGAGPEDVLKTTIYMRSAEDFEAINQAYADYFDADPPARSAVEAAPPVEGADVEIEAVATTSG